MPKKLEIYCPLLWELLMRWVDRRRGFNITNKVVLFTPLDVCISLGLPIVKREPLTIFEEGECQTMQLCGGKPITIEKIWQTLQQDYLQLDDEVENFTRLYILLAFAEFYFPIPCRGRPIFGGYIPLLDNVHDIDMYNWGLAVYEFLVNGLDHAANRLMSCENEYEVHLNGCAAVLQVPHLHYII